MTANGLSEKKNSILEINDLCFAYPEEKKRALNHVSLHVEDGEFLVLCGKSGCGKSTLLTHLKTPLTPHGKRKGEIFFQGVPIGEMSNREQSQRIGYVLQNGFLVTVFIYGGIMNPAALFMSVYDFTWEGLLAIYISGIPVDLVHASSTFIFLWIGAKPLLEKLQRIKIKYDLMR